MTRKKRAWLSVSLFLVIFAGLLITATFTDFQVSQFLTSKALAAHTYLTNASVFGVAFEAVGSDPVYLAFAFEILFWYAIRKKTFPAAAKTVLAGAAGGASFIANYVLVSDTMGYIEEHITGEYGAFVEHDSLETHGWLLLIVILTALLISALGLLATKNFTDEQIEKLCSVAIAGLPDCVHRRAARDQKAGRPHPLPCHERGRSRPAACGQIRLFAFCQVV